MRFFVSDQFNVALPQHADLCEQLRQLDGLPDTINGHVAFYVLDNPLAGMTCAEAGELLNVPERTVRDMCSRGDISAHRYPMRWRIPIQTLDTMDAGGDAV